MIRLTQKPTWLLPQVSSGLRERTRSPSRSPNWTRYGPGLDWEFGFDLTDLAHRVEAGTASLGEVNVSLAAQATTSWHANAAKLRSLYQVFAVLCVLVGLQVVAWALAVF